VSKTNLCRSSASAYLEKKSCVEDLIAPPKKIMNKRLNNPIQFGVAFLHNAIVTSFELPKICAQFICAKLKASGETVKKEQPERYAILNIYLRIRVWRTRRCGWVHKLDGNSHNAPKAKLSYIFRNPTRKAHYSA
jgi:hypothetical protein